MTRMQNTRDYVSTRIISGIRPTGKLHLGNYIGSILPALKHDADVLIATYHTGEVNAENINSLYGELTEFFTRDKILLHHNVLNPVLFFRLLAVTPTGLLLHMPQYKEKDKNALMMVYPVLMAHDIVGYDKVIVGEDQRPHIELAKDILHKIGEKCPEPIYEGGKVMDLRHPEQKMSKSNPESCLFLSDSLEVMEKKIKKAVTDEAGRKNLEFIYRSLSIEPVFEHSVGSHSDDNRDAARVRCDCQDLPKSNVKLKEMIVSQLKELFHE